MQDGAQGVRPIAAEEARDLLRISPVSAQGDLGYIDLLGDVPKGDLTLMQRTMRSKVIARIYHRLWRPFFVRLMFGWRGPRFREEQRMVMGMLSVSNGDRVLDVGCGPGTYTRPIAEAAGDGLVIGIDPSTEMLDAALVKQGMPNIAYVRGDAGALPFEDGVFDALCCSGAIHAMHDPERALDEMVRVLGDGGRLALMAACAPEKGRRRHMGKGVTVFERDELAEGLARRGLVGVEQVVFRRAQLVSARKGA